MHLELENAIWEDDALNFRPKFREARTRRGGVGTVFFTVLARSTVAEGAIFTIRETLISHASSTTSQKAYSWWSDPTSLGGILIFFIIFALAVIVAWRSPEREERRQPQRTESERVTAEVSVEPFVNALKSAD